MADVVFILLALGFFGLCVAYVRGLDRLVRTAADETASEDKAPDTPDVRDPSAGGRSRRAPGQAHAGTREAADTAEVVGEVEQ